MTPEQPFNPLDIPLIRGWVEQLAWERDQATADATAWNQLRNQLAQGDDHE